MWTRFSSTQEAKQSSALFPTGEHFDHKSQSESLVPGIVFHPSQWHQLGLAFHRLLRIRRRLSIPGRSNFTDFFSNIFFRAFLSSPYRSTAHPSGSGSPLVRYSSIFPAALQDVAMSKEKESDSRPVQRVRINFYRRRYYEKSSDHQSCCYNIFLTF